MIMVQVEKAYNGVRLSRRNLNTFIKYISQRNIDTNVKRSWQYKFTGLQTEVFPAMPQAKHQPSANVSLEHYITTFMPQCTGFYSLFDVFSHGRQ